MVVAVKKGFFTRFKAAREERQSITKTGNKRPNSQREGNKTKPIRNRVFKTEKLQERALDKKRLDFFFIEGSESVV